MADSIVVYVCIVSILRLLSAGCQDMVQFFFSSTELPSAFKYKILQNTSLAAPGGTRLPPATPHRLQIQMAVTGPQNGRRGPERGLLTGNWALQITFAE